PLSPTRPGRVHKRERIRRTDLTFWSRKQENGGVAPENHHGGPRVMRAPVAKAAIKWLDLSPGELRRARNLIRDWQGERVLDELGLGIMQSAIADRLHPATSTIMTRSRYP